MSMSNYYKTLAPRRYLAWGDGKTLATAGASMAFMQALKNTSGDTDAIIAFTMNNAEDLFGFIGVFEGEAPKTMGACEEFSAPIKEIPLEVLAELLGFVTGTAGGTSIPLAHTPSQGS